MHQFNYTYFTYFLFHNNLFQASPPRYDLSKMSANLVLFSSPDDILTTEKDVNASFLPNVNPAIIKEYYHIPGFSHMDFALSLNATDLVYNKIIAIINANQN